MCSTSHSCPPAPAPPEFSPRTSTQVPTMRAPPTRPATSPVDAAVTAARVGGHHLQGSVVPATWTHLVDRHRGHGDAEGTGSTTGWSTPCTNTLNVTAPLLSNRK